MSVESTSNKIMMVNIVLSVIQEYTQRWFKMKNKKSQSSEKILPKQNAQSVKHKYSHKYFQKKFNEEYGLASRTNRPLFYIGLKQKEDGFKRGGIYPVYLIENSIATVTQPKLSPVEKLIKKKYGKLPKEELRQKIRDTADSLDDDDIEFLEEHDTPEEPVEMTMVWLFIANPDNGKFGWVDSSSTFYLE